MNHKRPEAEVPPSQDCSGQPNNAFRHALRERLRYARHQKADKQAVLNVVLSTFHAPMFAE